MMKKHLLRSMLLLFALIVGSGTMWGQSLIVGNSPLTSVSDGDLVVWGTSNTNLATSCSSNWIYCSSTSSEWIVFTVEKTTNGFYLKTTNGEYVYSSATKKVAFSTQTNEKTELSIASKDQNHTNLVYGGSSIGYYTFNSSGIRPYTSNAYTDAHLYSVTYAHTLTYSATNGSIGGVIYGTSTAVASGASVAEGGKVTLTATADDGYTFTGWSVDSGTLSSATDNPTTFTMGTANATVTANFAPLAGDYITVNPTSANIDSSADIAEFALTTNIASPSYSVAYYTSSTGEETTTKPSWLGDVEFSGNTLDIAVNANTGAARSAYLKVYSGDTYSPVITINQAALTVNPPSFDPESGTQFIGDDVVMLSCTTPNATIYYTMGDNPADPTNASTQYDPNNGIEVTANTTIKAIAYVGEVASTVATATYTVVHPLTTMDAIFDASETTGSYYVTMNNWVVTGVKNSQAFVTDGTKGFIIYNSNHGFAVGNVLSGTVQASLTRYKGAAEFTSLTSSTSDLIVTTGGTVTPQVVAISDLSGVNTGAVIKVENVTYSSSSLTLKDGNDNEIKPHTTLYSGSYTNNTIYNVTGVYQQYDNTKQILPRSSADVVEVHDPTLTASLTTAVPNYVQGTPEENITSGTLTVGGSFLTDVVTVALAGGASSAFEIYDAANTTWTSSITLSHTNATLASTAVSVRLKAGKTAGDYEGQINITSTGATAKNVAVAASVTTLTVTYDANGAGTGTAPIDANNYTYNAEVTVLGNTGNLTKEHYTFDDWNTKADGTGYSYIAGNKFDITANTTLYAQWIGNMHTVTLPETDEYGEYTMDVTNDVAYGTEVTLTFTPAAGYENYVATWSVNGSPISGNKFNMPDEAVTVTVSLTEVFEITLSNSDIVAAGDATSGYNEWEITDGNNKTWNANAIKDKHSNNTSSYHFLQIKKYASSTAYYIQVPEYGRKITKLEITVSNSNNAMNDGGNTQTLFFSASNSTSATGTGVASGTGAKTVSIDCSSLGLNTGYITASGAVRIWDVKVTYDPIKLNSYGYATYAGLTPIDYSDDSKFSAWAITDIDGDAITFSKITGKVPAGTGVLLMGTAGQSVEPVVAASGTALATNLLEGITTETTISADTYYGLSGQKFVRIAAGKVPAGRAVLPVSEIPGGARQLDFVFEEDGTTGVNDVRSKMEDVRGEFFNLNGQRVDGSRLMVNGSRLKPGLYIVNGRKVVIK